MTGVILGTVTDGSETSLSRHKGLGGLNVS